MTAELIHRLHFAFTITFQLVPNSNSMGMPVTTPKTKLMPKILPQKRAARSHSSLPVLSATDLSTTISQIQQPIELGGRIYN